MSTHYENEGYEDLECEDEEIGPVEKIVKIEEACDGKTEVFFTIYDTYLNYWRSNEPIHGNRAWTRDATERAKYPTLAAAEQELEEMDEYRAEATWS